MTSQSELLDLFQLLRPFAMRKNAKLRVGGRGDGAYVLPHCVLICDALVSIGIGNNVEFDLVLAQHGMTVLQYDHTVDAPPVAHERFVFRKKGWGESSEGDFVGLEEILADLRQLQPRRSLLKFDIEGGEYAALRSVSRAQLETFDVIACEFHDMEKLGDPAFFESARDALGKLHESHAPVHLHPNNALGMVFVQGIAFPRLFEVTYLRRDLDQFLSFSTEPIPGPLDAPNLPQLPDICLNVF